MNALPSAQGTAMVGRPKETGKGLPDNDPVLLEE